MIINLKETSFFFEQCSDVSRKKKIYFPLEQNTGLSFLSCPSGESPLPAA
jgi:hypothetical protein